MEHPIDFVVTWLDSSDLEWQKEYNKYKGINTDGDNMPHGLTRCI